MTDQIPADKVREIIAAHRDGASRRAGVILAALEALLPAPPRPTLADMTDDERFNAVGMWADVDGFHPYRAVIGDIPAPKVPVFSPTAGSLDWVHPEDVTPLPELGHAWSPGGSPTGTPAPAPTLPEGWRLADHQKYGRVIVTNTTPNRDGRVYVVRPSVGPLGCDCYFCAPDELTYLDQEADSSDAAPPNTLAVGSVWEDARAFNKSCREAGLDKVVVADRDGDVDVWDVRRGRWICGGSTPRFAPYTIIHTGQGADQ